MLLSLALALAGLAQTWDLGRRSPGLDFYQFWVVAQVAGRDDVANVYGDEARARVGEEFVQRSLTDEDSERRRVAARPWKVLEPLGTPLLYTAFRPLSGGSYEGDYARFRLLSMAACVAGLLGIARLVGHGPALALLVLGLGGATVAPPSSITPRVLAVAALLAVAVDPLTAAFGLRVLQHQAIVTSLAVASLLALLCLEISGWGALPATEAPA